MFEITIFGKENCAKCSATKKKVNHFITRWEMSDRAKITFVDMDSMDGLAEGAFQNVNGVPTTILSDGTRTLGRWDEKVPLSEELKQLLVDPQ